MISCHNLVICRIEYHRALLLQQIHAEALVLIIQIHQTEKRRHYIHLHAQARILLLRNTRTEDDERNVVVRLRQLALALTHQLAMVCLNHEYRVLIPRLPACLLQKVAYRPVGILHYLRFLLLGLRLEEIRNDIWRMIAHGEDGSHERLARLRLLVDGVEGIAHLEMVTHTKAVHHLALRIVLLREDVIVAIGLEESLHVVILCLVGHEEHVLVAILLQHRGDTLAARSHRSLHQVAEHEGRETVERSRHAMVGMDAGTIEVGERQGMMIERIERWGERLLIAESTQKVCRHRLHQYHHHVRMILLHQQRIIHHLTLQNIRAIHLSRNTEPLAGIRDSLSVRHEMQFLVLLAHIVERRSKEIEGRIDAKLVEEGILAIVSLAHLDWVIAHSATDAEKAGAYHHRRNKETTCHQH